MMRISTCKYINTNKDKSDTVFFIKKSNNNNTFMQKIVSE